MQRGKTPYRRLGERLTEIRKSLQESVVEVSGAVELEADIIARYEKGETRPSEDVLDLLIRHFDLEGEEADELWKLAGYGPDEPDSVDVSAMQTHMMMVIPVDNRVVYTDTANVTVNNFGVVMNFMQNGPNGQPAAVARVGMSLEHAKSVLEVLQTTIRQAEASKDQKPKLLPPQS